MKKLLSALSNTKTDFSLQKNCMKYDRRVLEFLEYKLALEMNFESELVLK